MPGRVKDIHGLDECLTKRHEKEERDPKKGSPTESVSFVFLLFGVGYCTGWNNRFPMKRPGDERLEEDRFCRFSLHFGQAFIVHRPRHLGETVLSEFVDLVPWNVLRTRSTTSSSEAYRRWTRRPPYSSPGSRPVLV